MQDEALRLDVINDAEFKSIPFINTNEHDSIDNENGSTPRAFLFLDADENLQIATPELFCKKLKCQSLDKIKVISIFGNTGDGKSHTMNQVFFDGEPVFRTSPEQSSCTIGVYAAMQREQGVLCLDTEGLLGTTAKSNKRMRMLLKVCVDLSITFDFSFELLALWFSTDFSHFGYCGLSHTLGAFAQWYVRVSRHRLEGVLPAFHSGAAGHGQWQHSGTSCDHIPWDSLHKAAGEQYVLFNVSINIDVYLSGS